VFRDLVLADRSYRRFVEDEPISESTLRDLVDLARCTASAGNMQPLKYILSWTRERNDLIFPTLAWAGYLKDWPGPEPGERPSGYVIILGDRRVCEKVNHDHGIAAQTILLGAAELGYGGCMIGSVDRDALRGTLSIPEHYSILLVLAIGKPAETVVLEDVGADGSIKYYRDSDGVHHVPKRKLEDIIIEP
jgi:nitroreductase